MKQINCYAVEGQTNTVGWGFLPGTGTKLLVMKTGTGGNIYGYNNKYFHIARHFQSIGYSVLCCDTPLGMNDLESFQTIFEVATQLMGPKLSAQTIHYMGVSRGAYQGILHSNTIPQIQSLLLINTPLMINFSKQIAALRATDKRCTLVIGTQDASAQFLPLLKQIKNPNLTILEIAGADHHFKGMDEDFFNLPIQTFLAE